jgi:hypothetical protein
MMLVRRRFQARPNNEVDEDDAIHVDRPGGGEEEEGGVGREPEEEKKGDEEEGDGGVQPLDGEGGDGDEGGEEEGEEDEEDEKGEYDEDDVYRDELVASIERTEDAVRSLSSMLSAALALTVTVGVGVALLLTTAVVATWKEVRDTRDLVGITFVSALNVLTKKS